MEERIVTLHDEFSGGYVTYHLIPATVYLGNAERRVSGFRVVRVPDYGFTVEFIVTGSLPEDEDALADELRHNGYVYWDDAPDGAILIPEIYID